LCTGKKTREAFPEEPSVCLPLQREEVDRMTGNVLLVLRLLLAASLLAFLGYALLVQWRDLRRNVKQASIQSAPAITLSGSKGNFRFTKVEVLVGRDPTSDIVLDDKTVSTQHARFSYHHNHWWLEDLGSTNGTFLNQEQVTSPAVVVSGDEVLLGQVEFNITITGEGAQENFL
jgi:hypothetical protein